MTILDFLAKGAANAVTADEIAKAMDVDVRFVRKLIQIERIQGVPICASNKEPFGYFVAENQQELQDYVHGLKRRLRNIFAAYTALLELLDVMSGQERITDFFREDEE